MPRAAVATSRAGTRLQPEDRAGQGTCLARDGRTRIPDASSPRGEISRRRRQDRLEEGKHLIACQMHPCRSRYARRRGSESTPSSARGCSLPPWRVPTSSIRAPGSGAAIPVGIPAAARRALAGSSLAHPAGDPGSRLRSHRARRFSPVPRRRPAIGWPHAVRRTRAGHRPSRRPPGCTPRRDDRTCIFRTKVTADSGRTYRRIPAAT